MEKNSSKSIVYISKTQRKWAKKKRQTAKWNMLRFQLQQSRMERSSDRTSKQTNKRSQNEDFHNLVIALCLILYSLLVLSVYIPRFLSLPIDSNHTLPTFVCIAIAFTEWCGWRAARRAGTWQMKVECRERERDIDRARKKPEWKVHTNTNQFGFDFRCFSSAFFVVVVVYTFQYISALLPNYYLKWKLFPSKWQ